MPPRSRRTVIIKTGNFPSSLSAADMVERITSHLEISTVEAVQILPGRQARITFKNVQSKTLYEAVSEMTFGEVVCPVYVPRYTSQVMVYLYPFECENDKISKALIISLWRRSGGSPSGMGKYRRCRYQYAPC